MQCEQGAIIHHPSSGRDDAKVELTEHLLELGDLQFEKCELDASERTFQEAFEIARGMEDTWLTSQAIAKLLQLAGENLDNEKINFWQNELDQIIHQAEKIHPDAWYGKGKIEDYQGNRLEAQRYYHRAIDTLRLAKNENLIDEPAFQVRMTRYQAVMVTLFLQKGQSKRAEFFIEILLKQESVRSQKSIRGILYYSRGVIFEQKSDYTSALNWYRRADAMFLSDHNWYFHLYVLMRYGRLARLQQRFEQASWYLELVEHATDEQSFGYFRNLIYSERDALRQESVDIVLDADECSVRTREQDEISFGKQYVLFDILKALSLAHRRSSSREGLSKSQLIEQVWQENYRPEAHDNKLYYNINRLRKLIEPDSKRPKYLLNWKEGYRLAPGIRVQLKIANDLSKSVVEG